MTLGSKISLNISRRARRGVRHGVPVALFVLFCGIRTSLGVGGVAAAEQSPLTGPAPLSVAQAQPNMSSAQRLLPPGNATAASPSIEEIVAAHSSSERIVGGTAAQPGQWPSMVAIFVRPSGASAFNFCGGTIIAPRWVLTAAHCAAAMVKWQAERRASFFVREGTSDLAAPQHHDINVTRILPHENYDAERTINDVALLELDQAAQSPPQSLLGQRMIPNAVVENRMGTVVGFGVTTEGSEQSSAKLLQVDIPIVSTAKCQGIYGSDHITDASFCAGDVQGGKDSCQGDSGGPLFVRASGQPVQAGVVSWGKGCGRPGIPGVYASVGTFESWIKARVLNVTFVATGTSDSTTPGPGLGSITNGADTSTSPSQLAQVSVDILQGNSLKVGSFVDIRVLSSVPGRLALFNQDSTGRAVQIFPSRRMPSGQVNASIAQIAGGTALLIPPPRLRDQGFRFVAKPPLGRNRLIAIVLPMQVRIDDVLGRYDDGSDIANLDALINELADRELASRGLEPTRVAPVDRAVAERFYDIVP